MNNNEENMTTNDSDSQNKLPHLFPAFCSMILPGLGQLIQGRGKAFAGQLALYVLTALVPYCGIISLLNEFPFYWTSTLFSFSLLLVFPIVMIFFSVLDAACWKTKEKSQLTKPFYRLVVVWGIIYFLLFVLLFPVTSTAREAARRMQCASNLKQILLAMHNYHDDYKSLPPAYVTDASGKPRHSWRVLLLPYLDEKELYKKIRLNESWDSEYNKQFHAQTPRQFQCPSMNKSGVKAFISSKFSRIADGCSYSLVTGKETAFHGSEPAKFSDVTDGTSNTILLVERMVPVNWMNPTNDILPETASCGINVELTGIGSGHIGGCCCALADGSVTFLSEKIDPQKLKAFFTINGGDFHE
ncbi:MAG: DUF1559 domain-containing protein [Planctomycetaceae bacterium]|nr:DUF1559 domain-containing protein [Planctomycetaceae bacterium]